MPVEPRAHFGAPCGIEEANELLVAVPLHVAGDDDAVAHVERGKELWCLAACSRAPWCPAVPASWTGQAGSGPVPGSAIFHQPTARRGGWADRRKARRHHAVVDKCQIVGELELPPAGLKPVRPPDARDGADADVG